MWSFLKTFTASLLALIVFSVLIVFLIIGALVSIGSKDISTLHDNSVLKLTLDRPILEREYDNPLEELDLPVSTPSQYGLLEIKQAIKEAKTDVKIKGIYLQLSSLQAGISTIEEIRAAIQDFKTSGKFVYAYSEYLSEGAYYLSSVADSVFLNPSGLMEFNGLSSEIMFFKGTLEKLDLKPEIFKVGNYKSAVEPLILDKMSPANREQTLSFMHSIQSSLYAKIAEARKIPLEKLNLVADSMLIHKPVDAVRYGLIDKTLYYDQVEDLMRQKLGIEKKKELHFISYRKYASRLSEPEEDLAKKQSKNKIAVVIAQGDIQSGKGDEQTIGSDRIAEELRNAREDEDVRAIVLRINSPGGSSLASDVMWREVQLAAKEKPLIASMGDVAASGGYYMAMAADTIVAQPNTITGSIGVFGVLLNAQEFFKNKLGITFDGVKTGKFADIGTFSRPLTDYERKVIQKEVEDIYTDFVSKAAEGRNKKYEEIDQVASGRVWTGTQAKENGLVDVLGGFEQAVQIAATSAKLGTDYELVFLPKKREFLERVLSDVQESVETALENSSSTLGIQKVYKQILNKYNGVQARMPFDVKFE